MAQEHSGNSGYLALKKETTPGIVAGTPDSYVVMYEESLATALNNETENSIFRSKFARLQITPGIRSHTGDITVMAEPNTTHLFYDMLLTRGTVTGSSDPYTWPFTSEFTNPSSYTMDLAAGNQVFRYSGVGASEITPSWTDNEMRWQVKVSALKSFLGAEIASIATDTITLATPAQYPKPTECLVVGDAVTIWKPNDTSEDFTILSLTDTTVKLSATPSAISVAAGDMLVLKPATPSFSIPEPFLWSRTEFRVGATAAAALSATHTPMESGSEWGVTHEFEEDNGAQSSGSFDPSRLVRSQSTDATLTLRKFFETPEEVKKYVGLSKVAVVIRCFSGSNHEFRLTLNNLRCTAGGSKPVIKVDEALYYELEYMPAYDASDAQGFDVKVINAVAS